MTLMLTVSVRALFSVSVMVRVCLPFFRRIMLKVCCPASAAVKV